VFGALKTSYLALTFPGESAEEARKNKKIMQGILKGEVSLYH